MSVAVDEKAPSRRSRRKRRIARRGARWLAVLAVAFALAALATAIILDRSPPVPPVAADPADGDQITTLIALRNADDLSGQADSLTLFAIDRSGRAPTIVFIPVGTLGLIPGQGFDPIGKALTFGQVALQTVTVENLLGADIDRAHVVDDVALASAIDALGGIEVTVTERLLETDEEGRRQQVFATGPQRMDGPAAVTYLTYRGEAETELDRFVRAQKVWEAVLSVPDRSSLTAAFSAEAGEGFGALLEAFARVPADERAYEVLPTQPVGGGPDEVYRVDDPSVAQLVRRVLADSMPEPADWVGTRVEIRNGNGTPEVGEHVAERLVPAGYKIVVSGNANSFDFERTRVVVYGDDQRSLAIGRKVVGLLGVGEVEIGTRGQTVVDVTIVVGRDFGKE